MGKQKYQNIVQKLFQKSPVVNFASIERILKSKRSRNQYTKQLLRNLILTKKIKKLTKGFYSLHDDPSLIVFSFNPAYLGLQDALSKHNLWEQETIPIIITSKKVRQGIRNVNGSNVFIRRIDKKYIFGVEYLKEGDIYFPYSDIEKTFIDMVYYNEKINKETLESLKKKINYKKLNLYLKHYPRNLRKKVLSFIKLKY